MKKKDLHISLVFSVIGLIAGALIVSFQISTASTEFKSQLISSIGSVERLIIVGAIQASILTFIATFFGMKLAKRLDLKLYAKANISNLTIVIIISLFFALFITLSDKFIFSPYLPQEAVTYEFSFLYFISSILYGGIIEELLMRLFLMSLIAWILFKVFVRKKERRSIPSWIFNVSIIFAAIIFGLGHLPVTAQKIGLSTPILIRAVVLNGVGGIGFGYLYWKIGLSHAIYAHALTHVFNQLIIMPIFF
ncbi:MAG: type II CAAX prenyl endopeptidase Rce1 family protein [bacterium]